MNDRIRSLFRRAVTVLAAVVVLAGAGQVRAQSTAEPVTEAELDRPLVEPPRDPGEESKRRAAELFNQGIDLAGRGKTREALRAFRSAYERHATTDALANVAALELKLGKARAAAEHLTHALDRLLITQAEARADLRKRLAEAKALVGTVELFTDLQRAELQWNATWLGTGPVRRPVYVDPGTEHLLIARYGGVEYRRKLRLKKGETVRVVLTEADFPGAAPPPSAVVEDASSDGAADGATSAAQAGRLPWLLAGSGLAVGFAGVAAIGFAGAVVADGERTKIERDIRRFGGACGPPSVPGFADDCRARDQESDNHKINLGIGIAGAALAAGAVAVTLGVAFKVPEKNVAVVAGPGGVWVQGRF